MGTLSLNIDQTAQMAAKAAYDAKLAECLAAGKTKQEANAVCAAAGSVAYKDAILAKNYETALVVGGKLFDETLDILEELIDSEVDAALDELKSKPSTKQKHKKMSCIAIA